MQQTRKMRKTEVFAEFIQQEVKKAYEAIPISQRDSFSRLYVEVVPESNWLRIRTIVVSKSEDIYPKDWDFHNGTFFRNANNMRFFKKKKDEIMELVTKMLEKEGFLAWEDVSKNTDTWGFARTQQGENE